MLLLNNRKHLISGICPRADRSSREDNCYVQDLQMEDVASNVPSFPLGHRERVGTGR